MFYRSLVPPILLVMTLIPIHADAEPASTEDLQNQLDSLKQQVEQLSAQQAEKSGSSFNPDISLILSGVYGDLSQDSSSYTIPGITLGPETSPGPDGLSLAESELVISSNVDDWFYESVLFAYGESEQKTILLGWYIRHVHLYNVLDD